MKIIHLSDQIEAEIKKKMENTVLIQINKFSTFNRNVFSCLPNLKSLVPEFSLSEYETSGTFIYPPANINCSLEQSTKVRKKGANFGDFINKNFYSRMVKEKRKPIISVWNETDYLIQIKKQFNSKILVVRNNVFQKIEDKTNLIFILKSSGIPEGDCLKTKIFKNINDIAHYNELSKYLGPKFVVQVNSSGGKGTRIISSQEDLAKLCNEKMPGPVRVVQYYSGYSVNTNILTIPNGASDCSIYVDVPSHKVMGDSEENFSFGSIGNDWSLNFPEKPINKFIDYVRRVGKFLYLNYGLIGLWGVDSIWSDNDFRINEINCRFQGTTEVSSINQLIRGCIPFSVTHSCIFLGISVNWMPDEKDFNQETAGLMKKNSGVRPFYLKVRSNYNSPIKINNGFRGTGVYSFCNNKLIKVLESNSTIAANLNEKTVLIVNTPLPETLSFPGTQLCTIEGMTKNGKGIFTSDAKLTNEATTLLKLMLNEFNEVT